MTDFFVRNSKKQKTIAKKSSIKNKLAIIQ